MGKRQAARSPAGAGRASLPEAWSTGPAPDAADLALLLEAVPDLGIYTLDPEGRVAAWNAGAGRIFGYVGDEVAGRHHSFLYPPEDRDDRLPDEALRAAAARGRFEERGWRVRKDGARLLAHLVLVTLPGDGAGPRGFGGIVRDVTGGRAEADDEVESLTWRIAHDLRAPLRAAQGFSRALVEDYGASLDARARDYAGRIADAAVRMDRMIVGIAEYGRIGRGAWTPRPVSLQAAVAGVLDDLGAEISRLEAGVRVEGSLPPVVGHAPTLAAIVKPLVVNALTFVAPGVRPRVVIRAERRGACVRLWVEDNGIGIAPEDRERIFGPFERLHGRETYPGHGLGLAVARRGAGRLGGAAGVEPGSESGSRFWIDLRRAAREPAAGGAEDGAEGGAENTGPSGGRRAP